MSKIIFDTDSAVNAGDHDIYVREAPATISASGLASGETVRLKMTDDDGATWRDINVEGAPVELTDTDDTKAILSSMRISFEKAVTTGAVRLSITNGQGT